MQGTEKTFSKAVILVENGLIGTQNQCLAVAQALGLESDIHHLHPNWLERLLAPYFGRRPKVTVSPDTLVIAAGRQAIRPALHVKKHHPDVTVVALQDPKTGYQQFDLIAAPAHDQVNQGQLFQTLGAPTQVNAALLQCAKSEFSDLARLPSPRIAVLIGGNSKTHSLSQKRLGSILAQLDAHEASYMMTASRRSGVDTIKTLNAFANAQPNRIVWDGQGPNPYHAMLAHADTILVTNDSVSMISDAASTGKPVYLLPLDGGSAKFDRFYDAILKQGSVRIYEGLCEDWDATPLNDAANVAQAIKSLK